MSAPPVLPVPSAPPDAPAPARSRRRALALRAARVIGVGALAYVSLWLAAVLGTLGLSFWAQQHYSTGERAAGINHLLRVDDRLWRGSAPGPDGYAELADRGVHTVVDLRAEDLSAEALALPAEAGLELERLPIRDGQTPTGEQVERFLSIMETSPGPVYVHCGAGVGRTGAVTAAYLVDSGQTSATEALVRNLAVGPPSVEQMVYALSADPAEAEQPPLAVQAVSRVLDAPRRINASLSLF